MYTLLQTVVCSIVWHFGSLINIHATEKLQERAIRFIYNDYETEYFQILRENNLCTLYADRLKGMCCEIYKVKKGISSAYMNDLLSIRPSNYHSRQDLNLYVPKVNQIYSYCDLKFAILVGSLIKKWTKLTF